MPVKAERAMKATAKKRGYGKKRTDRYVYGSPVMQKYFKHKRAKGKHGR